MTASKIPIKKVCEHCNSAFYAHKAVQEYEHIYAGRLRASKIASRLSVVRRGDIEQMLAERPYEKRQPRDTIVITELYTTENAHL